MRVYYFTDEKYAVENIKKRQLKLSFFDLVNDVFELKPFDFGKRKIRHAWQKRLNQAAKSQGFVSFCESWSVPTMWAHYANNHKGICYGFDLLGNEALKIDYVKTLRPFDPLALSDPCVNKSEVNYASRTKSSHWEYEDEWRQYVSLTLKEIENKANGQKLFFVNFSERLVLKEVIIGSKSQITSKSIREALLPTESVEIKTARPSFRNFKIVEQGHVKYQK